MVKKKACIFISGNGSNLNNLIKKSRDYNFPIKVELVICNNSKAIGKIFAKKKDLILLIALPKLKNQRS